MSGVLDTPPPMPEPELRAILGALDRDEVARVIDLNGSAPELSAALHRRFGARIVVHALGPDGSRQDIPAAEYAAYLARLEGLGVDPEAVSPKGASDRFREACVIATLDGFGARHKIRHLKRVMKNAIGPQSRLVLDVRRGSGAYPFLNDYGSCNTIAPAQGRRPARVVFSAEPRGGVAGDWSEIARELAGEAGFFTDLGEHSLLFVPRSDTLVVTFDNLDIAMTKREDRRPWGFSFIEAQGWSMLGVMANGWTWFRDAAVDAEFARLGDTGFFDRFARVVFYGASMGGYAAAAFAAACPGATVFVTSPQSTLDKAVVPWETRYKTAWDRDFTGPFGDAARASREAAAVHLLYDPYVPLDAGHAARFDAPNVRHWRCPLLGHRLGSSLQQMGALKDIATAAIEGRLDDATFYRLLRRRRDLPRYQRELVYHALDRNHPVLARRVCNFVLARREDKALRGVLRQLDRAA
ncbi:hypothetical protein E2L08_09080 [Palleronia sediminis]|uniref:Uncharacterized protein n=1 Tax=Palleronia sediminis TaxID=2547833 RepID=A0A4R6ADH7_9RHOB|nr:hypothetical protein [Palleronia sediminis]TDL79456.1 hypothetical protein E2L08_09080 [Palleronia sediminis]